MRRSLLLALPPPNTAQITERPCLSAREASSYSDRSLPDACRLISAPSSRTKKPMQTAAGGHSAGGKPAFERVKARKRRGFVWSPAEESPGIGAIACRDRGSREPGRSASGSHLGTGDRLARGAVPR